MVFPHSLLEHTGFRPRQLSIMLKGAPLGTSGRQIVPLEVAAELKGEVLQEPKIMEHNSLTPQSSHRR